jgi:hypothetical protein
MQCRHDKGPTGPRHGGAAISGLNLDHLEHPGVRARMLSDWILELEGFRERLPRDRWPFGRGLNDAGWDIFLASMPVALREKDITWLADTMNDDSLWVPFASRSRNGRPYQTRVNVGDAALRLALGEYNIAYTKAVASMALEAGIPTCEIYRAGYAAQPRTSCMCLEGPGISCRAVLEGHRAYVSGPPAEFSIPAGPHCHHAIRIQEWVRLKGSPDQLAS